MTETRQKFAKFSKEMDQDIIFQKAKMLTCLRKRTWLIFTTSLRFKISHYV
jgi:hypothetical protein